MVPVSVVGLLACGDRGEEGEGDKEPIHDDCLFASVLGMLLLHLSRGVMHNIRASNR